MAISLGFGIFFATLISLGLVPCLYLILEDIKGFFESVSGRLVRGAAHKVTHLPSSIISIGYILV